jgi:hypothetical protein
MEFPPADEKQERMDEYTASRAKIRASPAPGGRFSGPSFALLAGGKQLATAERTALASAR